MLRYKLEEKQEKMSSELEIAKKGEWVRLFLVNGHFHAGEFIRVDDLGFLHLIDRKKGRIALNVKGIDRVEISGGPSEGWSR